MADKITNRHNFKSKRDLPPNSFFFQDSKGLFEKISTGQRYP